MPPRPPHSFLSRSRRIFRRFRFAVYALFFLLAGCLVYLNQIGLPDVLKRKLVAELQSRGLALEFSRMRLHWTRGLIAEAVTVGRTTEPDGPEFSIGELAVDLDRLDLLRLRLKVDSVRLRDGRLVVPLVASNEPPQQFVVDKIQSQLRLLPNDQWQLDQFQALCLGAQIDVHGALTHASAVRRWQFKRTPDRPPGLWQTQLRQANKIVQQMRFRQPPQITLEVHGDALDPATITADVRFKARAADTDWGRLEKLMLNARLNRPSGTNDLGRSDLKILLEDAATRWGRVEMGTLSVDWQQAVTNASPAEVNWDFEFTGVDSRWGRTPRVRLAGRTLRSPDGDTRLHTELTAHTEAVRSPWADSGTNFLTAQFVHAPDNFIPLEADFQYQVDEPRHRLGSARTGRFSGHLVQPPLDSVPTAEAGWAWWANLRPFHIDWEGVLDGVTVTNIQADRVSLSGRWRAPELFVDALHADLYDRQLDAAARVNIASRETEAQTAFDFDVHRIASLLRPNTRRWLSQYTWSEPPIVTAGLKVILPAWTNTHPDWRGEVLPTLQITGRLQGRNAAFRGVPVESAHSHFHFSNLVWTLPDFVAVRPEGRIEFAHASHLYAREYHFKVRGSIDPLALRPLLEEKHRKAFEYFQFTGPVFAEGEVGGRWREPEETRFDARLVATNFTFRGVPVTELAAAVRLTNLFLSATGVEIRSGEQYASAPGIGFDIETQMLHLTNATGTMAPARVAHAIGPRTEKNLSPYVFENPPTALVNGFVNVRDSKQADLRFDIAGGPFSYWKFNVPLISGTVRWQGETVTLSNLQADFYGGRLEAGLFFDFTEKDDAEFNFRARVADADLHGLMSDLHSPTNRLEGIFSGDLAITHARSADWKSWQGYGSASLRDGFLWDIPLFGIFTPLLEPFVPGLANSRVSGGAATYVITNSVIHTGDMEIRSPAMRLIYRGAIDFNGNVDARVEARVLRDVWMIGPLVSLVLSPLTKLFEYKVTGTLSAPEKEPLYIPKPLLFPFHPLRTLKELFGEEPKPTPPQPPPSDKPLEFP